MGDIADDLLNGACCSYCSQYFVDDHGYSVLCNDCWNKATKKEREGYQKATEKEI